MQTDETRELYREYRRLFRLAFGDRVREQRRKWFLRHKEAYKAYRKKWFEGHPGKKRDYDKRGYEKYYARHGEKICARRRARKNHRWETDENYRILGCLRSRINALVKNEDKSANTMKLLGCSIEDLWIYLESKFQTGMTRENYGKVWHIDHIIPCAIFDLTKPEHQKRCFHFSNLQPLLGEENLRKSAKVTTNQFRLL